MKPKFVHLWVENADQHWPLSRQIS